jgi:hypothetical protein
MIDGPSSFPATSADGSGGAVWHGLFSSVVTSTESPSCPQGRIHPMAKMASVDKNATQDLIECTSQTYSGGGKGVGV